MADPTPLSPPPGVAAVVTHPSRPPGVLPRRGQVWLMLGVAGGIVAIILVTGHAPAPPRAAAAAPRPALAPNPDQLRSYQQRLAEADTRPRPVGPPSSELQPVPVTDRDHASTAARPPRPPNAMAEERARREYESLFASNVVQSPNPTLATEPSRAPSSRRSLAGSEREPMAGPPSLDEVAAAVVRASTPSRAGDGPTGSPAPAPTPTTASVVTPPPATMQTQTTAADGPLHWIREGTVIDTVLTHRLDGTAAAPVNCLVSSPVYAADGPQVLVPAGARLVGATKPVQSFGETRLAVTFTRLLLPNGRSYALDHFMGLNASGDAGLRDQVNQHYLSTFGASAAVGVISGFAQVVSAGFGNRASGPLIITGNVSDATAQATSQTMGRFLNRLPTITIREGHRVKVYLTNDLQLPVYQPGRAFRDAGLRLSEAVQP